MRECRLGGDRLLDESRHALYAVSAAGNAMLALAPPSFTMQPGVPELQ